MPFTEFEANILRQTAAEVLQKDIPNIVTDEQLLALYAYATHAEIISNSEVCINTIALLKVIDWLATSPKAYDVLQKIKEKYGHDGVGYEFHFVRALIEDTI